jgi:hypothetical protein
MHKSKAGQQSQQHHVKKLISTGVVLDACQIGATPLMTIKQLLMAPTQTGFDTPIVRLLSSRLKDA